MKILICVNYSSRVNYELFSVLLSYHVKHSQLCIPTPTKGEKSGNLKKSQVFFFILIHIFITNDVCNYVEL